jgi:hypothetical protein
MAEVGYYNLSGKEVPSGARLIIPDGLKPGDALVVMNYDGTVATCKWMPEKDAQQSFQALSPPAGEGPPKTESKLSDDLRDDRLR